MAGVLVLAAVIAWLLCRRSKLMKLSAISLAREELRKIIAEYEKEPDPVKLLRQVSVLLRRVSISLFPRTEVASLIGEEWLKFLDQPLTGQPFSTGKGRILTEAPYRHELATDDIETLLKHCRDWIDTVAVTAGGRK